ncbi:nuclear transport factor 2 family protein [Nocardioides aequoreus]|uniref:nuclear transport factor 2 family protein n=1 Tax=Nocardioides aequoreus TaxID=397278 RepID=UPI0004C425FB|nr:nuclear transport factor 2 family protein [Nocardioides aequoreus]
MTTTQDIHPDQLPTTIRAFLAAHTAREASAALRCLTEDVVVTDQGETFRGTEQVRDFLLHAGSEFTYTTQLVAARRLDDIHWVAVLHLEGDFPGGVADLDYRFTLTDGLVSELAIG